MNDMGSEVFARAESTGVSRRDFIKVCSAAAAAVGLPAWAGEKMAENAAKGKKPSVGWLVRRSDSVQPVHSWKWSHTTEGFFPLAAFSAIFSPAHAGSPTAAAAAEQTLMKSRRETPVLSARANTSEPMSFIPSSGWLAD